MMKSLKKWITSPKATIALFAVAAGLLLFATIGGARAALTIFSETYSGQLETLDMGVTLYEKSQHSDGAEAVASRNYEQGSQDKWSKTQGVLLSKLLAEGEELVPGKAYTEEISVKNTGTINEWVRVTIYKYWLDPNGNKVIAADSKIEKEKLPDGMAKASDSDDIFTYVLSPDLIKLTYVNQDEGDGSGDWIRDKELSSNTEERTVFYYNKLLESGKDTIKTPLTSTIAVDASVAKRVTQTTSEDGKTIVTTYDYDGWRFCLEAEVDAVQEHNAVDAIKSAWGKDVTIRSNGTLQLN